MRSPLLVATLALPLAFAACDGSTGPTPESAVAVRFGTAAPTASAFEATARAANGMTIAGTNGTLLLTNVAFIVSEVELERLESTCDNSGSGNLCDDFEVPMSFVRLPLAGGAITIATDGVPHGDYDELDFEIEDLTSDSDDDAAEQQEATALLNAIRTTHGFADFPTSASMVIEGSFTPTGSSQARPFRAYFAADIEAELRFDPALTIDASGANRAVTIAVDPALWLRRTDGTVTDLSQLDYATTNTVIPFELEITRGFTRVERGS